MNQQTVDIERPQPVQEVQDIQVVQWLNEAQRTHSSDHRFPSGDIDDQWRKEMLERAKQYGYRPIELTSQRFEHTEPFSDPETPP